jgi:hypothetical protein
MEQLTLKDLQIGDFFRFIDIKAGPSGIHLKITEYKIVDLSNLRYGVLNFGKKELTQPVSLVKATFEDV